ncbi:MAG: UDP-N-acetylmuramoyl-L-alanine--D-glutamate ligase [Clostridia bacterium]|nr:UDP-N-acetylmuramoyl-L-alanine--D-glutamate ligase [Clostridia bacterium]
MENCISKFRKMMKDKKVAVLGIGISNTPLIKYLYSMGADITAFDKSDKEKLEQVLSSFKGLDIKYSLGEDYLKNLKGFDVVFRTPGMRYDLPELVEARKNGAQITSEMEVFFDLCPAEIFAVTGSDGKTTTTTLIYNMLKEQGYVCWLGGNIGMPLLSRVEEIKETDKVVLELSSFQLHTMRKSPHVAVITNISPNHLDVHKSMEEYTDAKKNIFRFQSENDKLVLNFDNEITKQFGIEAKGKAVFFSRTNSIEEGAGLENGMLVFSNPGKKLELVKAEDISIPGVHNIENYLAASAAVIDYVEPSTIRKVAKAFKGVEHRIELVRELNGVKFYNSSIDSSPSRTIAALNTFKQKVILIAGGKDKGIPYDDIGEPIIKRVKHLVLIGATASKIEAAVKEAMSRMGTGEELTVTKCNTYEEVVKTAYSFAKEGDIVILSPASTSFDMFRNFEERGNIFKRIVNSL